MGNDNSVRDKWCKECQVDIISRLDLLTQDFNQFKELNRIPPDFKGFIKPNLVPIWWLVGVLSLFVFGGILPALIYLFFKSGSEKGGGHAPPPNGNEGSPRLAAIDSAHSGKTVANGSLNPISSVATTRTTNLLGNNSPGRGVGLLSGIYSAHQSGHDAASKKAGPGKVPISSNATNASLPSASFVSGQPDGSNWKLVSRRASSGVHKGALGVGQVKISDNKSSSSSRKRRGV